MDKLLADVLGEEKDGIEAAKAILMTCCIPTLVQPIINDNKCYIDGGVVSNYPLNHCISHGKNINEILSFKNNYTRKSNK